MDMPGRQHPLHIGDQRIEQLACLIPRQRHALQHGRGCAQRPRILHQDRVVCESDGLRHAHAYPFERLERGILVRQPGDVLHLLALARAHPDGEQRAAVTDRLPARSKHLPTLAVERIVAQVAKLARPVDLRRDEAANRCVCARLAAVDGRLLAALDLAQHVRDELLLVERAQVVQDPHAFVARRLEGRVERRGRSLRVLSVRQDFVSHGMVAEAFRSERAQRSRLACPAAPVAQGVEILT